MNQGKKERITTHPTGGVHRHEFNSPSARLGPMYAVILAGGSGTRQRPLSGHERSLTFARQSDGRTLLQRTVERLAPLIDPMDITVVTDARFGQTVREQLPEAVILTEPMNRHTAASIVLATVVLDRPERDVMLVLSTDHVIDQEAAFRQTLATAERELTRSAGGITRPLLTFGVRPSAPDPEFSWIRPRQHDGFRAGGLRAYPVDGIEAKPEDGRARTLFAGGTAYWNAGIFLWQRGAIREAIERYTPLLTMIEPAWRSEIALGGAYDRLQPLSIDEAVLTGAARDGGVLMAALDVGWSAVTA
ncbi:MAG: NTP transferase domain-containing protein [Chloroflexi bacterium]|nr:NTP transferase domain-containing protein [Chloroflexota bacterium]